MKAFGVLIVYALIILGLAGIGVYCLTHGRGGAGWFLICVGSLMALCLKVQAKG